MSPASTLNIAPDGASGLFPVAPRVLAIKRTLIARYVAAGHSMEVIREAIATAESQAWLSGFPDLFLPALAEEILEHLRQRHVQPEYAQAA